MDTIIQPSHLAAKPRTYRAHTVEFKRAVVAQTLIEGASVSLIARAHDVNTNQVFAWRKLYHEGRLGGGATDDFRLLPIAVVETTRSSPAPEFEPAANEPGVGEIELAFGKARFRIIGKFDVAALALVLERVLR